MHHIRLACPPLVVIPSKEVAREVDRLESLTDHHERDVIDRAPSGLGTVSDVLLRELHRLLALVVLGTLSDPDEDLAPCVEQHDVVLDQIGLIKVINLLCPEVPENGREQSSGKGTCVSDSEVVTEYVLCGCINVRALSLRATLEWGEGEN